MRIAIIDFANQDIGLKILFPEADYYVEHIEFDCKWQNMNKFNITPIFDWSNINSNNYDILLIILCSIQVTMENHGNNKVWVNSVLQIIETNNFKKVAIFDNYDYMYDPNDYIQNDKVDFFFKRNYNKTKIYKDNVIPFPFFCFGYKAMIEDVVNNEDMQFNKEREDLIFFTGALFEHINEEHGVYINRIKIYNEISSYISNPGYLDNSTFMHYLNKSKYGLDLLGVGEPNKRTMEILTTGALLLSQEPNNIKWPFDEEFSQETKFLTSADFITMINNLRTVPYLYEKCINNQNYIVKKYFNKKWLRNYILEKLAI